MIELSGPAARWPPIAWVGGKRSCLHEILPRFPLTFERYIECFGGSGVVLFGKRPTTFEVWNDLNGDLYNFYYCVKHKHLQLLKELDFLPFTSRQEFYLMRSFMSGEDIDTTEEEKLVEQHLTPAQAAEYNSILKNRCQLGTVSRAAAFFKLNRLSYGAGMTSFSSQPTDLRSFYRQITHAHDRLRTVVLENKDCEALIRQYDRSGAFFYLDPPYYQAEGCYAVDFTEQDHTRLREVLGGIQGKFLLSYNDREFVRELYKGYEMYSFSRLSNLVQRYEGGAEYKEILIANYDMTERGRMSEQITLFPDRSAKHL